MPPISVVCDRCRAEGLAGEDPFEAFGDLLDFDPVPRRTTRADGWDGEVQRAFIAALSLTGSDRAAARAVGKAQFGVTQLLNAPGCEGFAAARQEALAIAADERSRRLAEGVRAIAAEQSGWRPQPAPWSRAAPPAPARPANDPAACPDREAEEDRVRIELLQALVDKYALKLVAERRERLAGHIAAADFYVRQLTALEVALDVVSGDGMALLKQARLGNHDLRTIAETPMSKLLDEARRLYWEECGDPPRPAPPCHLLEDQGGYRTEPLEYYRGGGDMAAQRLRYEEQHARDAEAQVAWEAAAHADWAARRADGRITDADVAPLPGEEEHWLDAAVRAGAALEEAERKDRGQP